MKKKINLKLSATMKISGTWDVDGVYNDYKQYPLKVALMMMR